MKPMREETIACEGGGEEVVNRLEIRLLSIFEVGVIKTGGRLPLTHEL